MSFSTARAPGMHSKQKIRLIKHDTQFDTSYGRSCRSHLSKRFEVNVFGIPFQMPRLTQGVCSHLNEFMHLTNSLTTDSARNWYSDATPVSAIAPCPAGNAYGDAAPVMTMIFTSWLARLKSGTADTYIHAFARGKALDPTGPVRGLCSQNFKSCLKT